MSANRRRRALISVSDKKGIVPFAEALSGLGFELVSTGGTASLLREAGLTVTGVAEITGFPEIMDGRIKTLHPKIHGALLARTGTDDSVRAEHGIELIDIVVVNLYPFASTIAKPDASYDEAIENIDIGGPAMIRAAAKNHERLTIIVDVSDYERVLEAFADGEPPFELRQELAAKAYAHTAAYDATVAEYLGRQSGRREKFPRELILTAARKAKLRYGENPHQQAAVYSLPGWAGASVVRSEQVQGKELSFNNLVDADTALACAQSFDDTTCVIVKHANPCGVGQAATAVAAYARAYAADPTSAFGGVIAFNRELDEAAATAILAQQFVEVVVAPKFSAGALEHFSTKPDVRILACGSAAIPRESLAVSTLAGGLLVQDADQGGEDDSDFRIVTRRKPEAGELAALRFAWRLVRFVKSNAIVFAADGQSLGIGAGQMSRIMSTRIAAMQAAEFGFALDGAAMASDAFFPFRDNVDLAAELGIRAIVQPGGSRKDAEVIAAADEHGIAMAFTGFRHFRH